MSKVNVIQEIESKLEQLDFKDFYRWIVINMPRLKEESKTTQRKSAGVLKDLSTHPRHSSSKY